MQTFRLPFEAMASRCEIVIAAADETQAHALAQDAIDEVKRIEDKYSRYRPDSVVSRINTAAGQAWIECDAETTSLFDYADALFRYSDGLFDITSGVLRRAWNFNVAQVPSAETLAPLLALIGWQRVERKEAQLRLPVAGMQIDFGGFGKEYAADRAASVLAAKGVQHGYVNLAGDLRVIGPQPDGQPWLIGIQDPRQQGRIVATIPVASGALATSGDYERFFEFDGQRYCHVLDPRTGKSVTHWRSVSVLAPLAVAAGSCTTIAMLKQAAGNGFLDDSGMAYLAIDAQGKILHNEISPG
jgi:FAD:protein FMN transferase